MTTTATIENLDTRLADTNKLIRKLGVDDANGDTAKPKAALVIAQARYDGILTDDSGEACYAVYLEGRKTVLSKTKLGDDNANSTKANVSKFTQILKAAGLAPAGINFVDVMTNATDERDALIKTGEKVKPAFEAYVDLARAQLKEPTVQLTPDQISDIVRKKEAGDKSIIDKMITAYKTARKIGDEFPCQPMADVVAGYAKAIEEAGGEVPAVSDDEKEEAAAMAFLAKKGLSLAPAPAPTKARKGETLVPALN